MIFLFLLTKSTFGFSQNLLDNAEGFDKKRTIGVSVFNGGLWAGSIGGLYFVWYKDFPKTKFHFFNDSKEWMGMDKLGHVTTAWNFARASGDLYKWAGVDNKKAALIGGLYSFCYMANFELLDATNENWGFSVYDLGANTIGSAMYFTQAYFWDEQKIKLKFSAHPTDLAQYRPQVLGSSFTESLFKDYNGQTYWLSFHPTFFKKENHLIPKWINLSLGYSINHHLVGDGSTFVVNNGNEQLNFVPYRQYFLSFDFDLENLPVKSKVLKLVLRGLNIIKFPLPAVEFSQGKVRAHLLYF